VLYTAQYRYNGHDRLDITVKGKHPIGRVFAPTWDMVMRYRQDGNTQIYTEAYNRLMMIAWNQHRATWDMLMHMAIHQDVTMVCFCPKNNFCHRYLLVNILVKYNSNILYGGER
jgi:hypothetical protein